MRIVPRWVRQRIANRPNLIKIVDNIGWLFLDKVLRMGVGLFVGIWLARYLGPEQFGLLNFALAFTGLFGAIAAMGLQGIVVRDLVQNPKVTRLTLGTAAVLHLVGGLLAFLLILFAIAQLRPDDPLARTIVAILGSIMLLKVSEIAVYWFESQVQSKYTAWVQSSVFLLFAAAKVVLILKEAPLIAFVWAMLAEAAVVAIILLFVMGARGPAINRLRASSSRAKVLLRDSWPLMLAGISVIIYMKIDQIMIGEFIDDHAVGVYSAAVRLSEAFYFVPVAIVATLFPAIMEAKSKGSTLYMERMQRLYGFMVVLSFVIIVPLTVLAIPLIVLLFGSAYYDAGVILAIHIWALVFVSLNLASGKWFIAENLQVWLFQRHALGALVNVIFNLFLIPRFGIKGAAVATIIAYIFAGLFFDLLRPQTYTMFHMKLKALQLFPFIASELRRRSL